MTVGSKSAGISTNETHCGSDQTGRTVDTAISLGGGLVDYAGLMKSTIWAEGSAPDERTLQRWARERRIPHFRIGRLVRFDVQMVREHILRTMAVQPIVARSGNVRRKYMRRAK